MAEQYDDDLVLFEWPLFEELNVDREINPNHHQRPPAQLYENKNAKPPKGINDILSKFGKIYSDETDNSIKEFNTKSKELHLLEKARVSSMNEIREEYEKWINATKQLPFNIHNSDPSRLLEEFDVYEAKSQRDYKSKESEVQQADSTYRMSLQTAMLPVYVANYTIIPVQGTSTDRNKQFREALEKVNFSYLTTSIKLNYSDPIAAPSTAVRVLLYFSNDGNRTERWDSWTHLDTFDDAFSNAVDGTFVGGFVNTFISAFDNTFDKHSRQHIYEYPS